MSGKVEIHVGTARCTVLWLASETRISLPSVPTASDDNQNIQRFQAFYSKRFWQQNSVQLFATANSTPFQQ